MKTILHAKQDCSKCPNLDRCKKLDAMTDKFAKELDAEFPGIHYVLMAQPKDFTHNVTIGNAPPKVMFEFIDGAMVILEDAADEFFDTIGAMLESKGATKN